MGRASAVLLALLLAAKASPADLPEGFVPVFLELRVNTVRGETALVHLDGEDVWVAVHDLNRAGLLFGGTWRRVADRPAVSLRSLAPEVRFEVDEEALVLALQAGPEALEHRNLDMSLTRRPPGLETGTAPSAFLNYAARATTGRDLSGSLEAGVSAGPALLQGSVSATDAEGAVRGLTSLWVDDVRRLVRLVAGDTATLPDALGGAPLVGGLSVVRELSLDPYLVRDPLPAATAFASTPSTVEVWVNGALVRTEAVAPGTYDLTRLPVTTGASDVRVLVRDSFGRTQTLESEHYQAQGLLRRGLHDWALHAGWIRRDFGRESFSYGDPVLLLRHRSGLGERVTAGYRLDLGPQVRMASLSATVALPIGQLDLASAASDDEGTLGGAGLAAWRYGARRFSLGADLTLRSRAFATSTLRAAADRALWRASVRATIPVAPRTPITLQWAGSRTRDGGTTQRLEARTSLAIAPRAWLVLSAAAEREGAARPAASAFVQVVVSSPGGATADAGARAGRGEGGGTVGAQRSMPAGPGFGWRFRGDTAAEGTLSALVQGQTGFGRYEATYDGSPRSEVASLAAAGGVVLLGERAFATRPVEQSFALVRVGVPEVRVRLENRDMGRTDGGGDLLLPGLLPYYGNRISIADADVPPDFRIGRIERTIAPPPRGGALVRFDVERLRALEGRVRLSGRRGPRIPSWGTLEVETPRGTRLSPIAEAGEFWLEDLPPGTHRARILFDGEVCEFGISVPESGPGVVEVGTLGCAEREEGGGADRSPP